MGVIKAMRDMKAVFPQVVTNEWINSMPRLQLTDKQKAKPYAKYYYKDMALVPEDDLAKFNAGAVPSDKLLPASMASEVLRGGYLPTEVGYGLLDSGKGVAVTKVFMPNVTTEMIDWWFNWHPLDGLRYMIWCPIGHTDIRAKTPELHLDSSGVPLHVRNIGRVHYPTEGFDVANTSKVEIAFREPSVLGLSQADIEQSSMSTFQIAKCSSIMPRLPINVFFHAVRQVSGGVEFRSHYWINHTIKGGKIKKSSLPIPKSMVLAIARNNCLHSLIEYNNLASILPQLYAEYGGEIKL